MIDARRMGQCRRVRCTSGSVAMRRMVMQMRVRSCRGGSSAAWLCKGGQSICSTARDVCGSCCQRPAWPVQSTGRGFRARNKPRTEDLLTGRLEKGASATLSAPSGSFGEAPSPVVVMGANLPGARGSVTTHCRTVPRFIGGYLHCPLQPISLHGVVVDHHGQHPPRVDRQRGRSMDSRAIAVRCHDEWLHNSGRHQCALRHPQGQPLHQSRPARR